MIVISGDLVAQVRHAWIADQQHPQRERRKRAIPDSERFGILLDTVFRTSMIPEEGRHVRANVAWLPVADLDAHEVQGAGRSERLLRFQSNRPLASALLAKLAKATESGSCSLLVDWFDGVPMIWGILYYRRERRTLEEIPAAVEEGIRGAPDCPILSIDGIGSIVVMRGDSVVGRITRGEFARAVPAPLHSHPLGQILHELFGVRMTLKAGRYVDDGDNSCGHILVECLRYLLEQLDRQAGGALLVFVPGDSIGPAREHAEFPWACAGSLDVAGLLGARMRSQEAQALLRARLDALVRLASIDGALVLSPRFDLVGFGAKLHAPAWAGTVLEGLDGFGGGGQPFDASRLGTRHSSAVAYVGAVPGAVAFVVSADGPIRGLARKGIGPIHCWPDCRLSLFA